MWSASPDGPPAGWAICDGNHGAPDLRGRFVRGLEDTQVEGLWDADGSPKGGARPCGFGVESHTLGVNHLPPHTHSATVTVGSHSHGYRSSPSGTVAVIAPSELDRMKSIKKGLKLAEVVPNPVSVLVDEVVKFFGGGGLPGDTAKALNIVGALGREGAAKSGLIQRTSGEATSSVSVSVDGGGAATDQQALDNRPAYHPLCFIMKLAPPSGGEAG